MSRKPPDINEINRHLSSCQDRLYAYALSLVGSRADAEDIVQDANIVLLRRAEDFEPGTDFGAWACRVLFYEVLAWRKTQSRNRLVFDDQMLSMVAQTAEVISEQAAARRSALKRCMGELTEKQRELLAARYASSEHLDTFAERLGRPVRSVYQSLHRVRTRLAACVRSMVQTEAEQ